MPCCDQAGLPPQRTLSFSALWNIRHWEMIMESSHDISTTAVQLHGMAEYHRQLPHCRSHLQMLGRLSDVAFWILCQLTDFSYMKRNPRTTLTILEERLVWFVQLAKIWMVHCKIGRGMLISPPGYRISLRRGHFLTLFKESWDKAYTPLQQIACHNRYSINTFQW